MKRRSFRFSGAKRDRLREELARRGGDDALARIVRRADLAVHPLSFGQHRLWFLERLEPGSASYLMPAAVRLDGPLDVAALAASLTEIVRRHDGLRARFPERAGEPVQRIEPPGELGLPCIDLSALDRRHGEAEAFRLMRGEAARPFDLAAEPLLRLFLARLGDGVHLLFINLHHIVTDGVSTLRFVGELRALYAACEGRRRAVSPLPELAIQYADYAAWQQSRLQGDYLAERLAWWREFLAGAPAVLELPADHPRRAVRRAVGARLKRSLSPVAGATLKKLAQQQGTTLFLAFLAVFKLFLHRLTGQLDLVVGTPFAGRDRRETAPLIGLFANVLVLRSRLGRRPTFVEVLQQLGKSTAGAFSYQDLPFERLVEAMQMQRNLSQTPLVQVLFALEGDIGVDVRRFRLGELDARLIDLERGAATFDFTLTIKGTADGLDAEAEYSTDLFAATTIGRWLWLFARLLEEVTVDPAAPLAGELLAVAERQCLLHEWNDTAVPEEGSPALLHELFFERARRQGEAVALIAGESRLTYRDLAERASRIADRLSARGVAGERRIGALVERRSELVAALLGILEAGGAWVGLDPKYPAERLAYMIEDSGAELLLTSEGMKDLPTTEATVIVLGDDDRAFGDTEPGPARPRPRLSPSNLAYLIYTSGSTGRPKAVAVSHRSAVELVRWARRSYSPAELAGVLATTSICFDLSVFELFVPLSWGGTVLLAQDALAISSLPATGDATLINTVPSAIAELAELGAIPRSVRVINLAGEALASHLVARIYERAPWIDRVMNLYGPSEDTTYSTFTAVPRSAAGEPTIGRPTSNSRALVVDAGLRMAPLGALGELVLGGAGLARGYLDRPAQTAAAFVPDPWSGEAGERLYRTGDRVRQGGDGELHFLGRLDRQIKLRGYRIELAEIEAALAAHPAVGDVVAMVREDRPGDPRLTAYVTPAAETSATLADEVSAAEWRIFLQGKLPQYMIPTAWVSLAELPRTPNGKLDRAALPAPSQAGADATTDAAPRTFTEETLAAIWADILGVDKVARQDDFFLLGGHSLIVTRLAARILQAFQVEVPLRILFELSRLDAQAEWLQRSFAAGGGSPRLERGSSEGPRPLSFAQQRLWFLDQLQPGSRAYHIPGAVRLRGPLRALALEEALRRLVERHEILRTRFVIVGGEPAQILDAAPATLLLPVIDLRACPGDPPALARRESAALGRPPFDLAAGPLLRQALLRLAADDHVLLVTLHHIVADGWSMEILVGELAALYRAVLTGEDAGLPELAVQYADFAGWQRRALEGKSLEQPLEYWRAQLAGVPVLELPTDRPRPALPSTEGGVVDRPWSEDLVRDLDRLAQAAGATRFMTLLAAFNVLLWRLSGQLDIATGWPITNRDRVELEGLIGMLTNTVVLRADLGGDPTFGELLGRVRETALGAYTHRDVPFEKLVELFRGEYQLNISPLFQVMLVMLSTSPVKHRPELAVAGLELELLGVESAAAKFDLTLFVIEQDGRLKSAFEYSRALFDHATVSRFLDHLEVVVQGALADPERPLFQLPWLRPEAWRQALAAGVGEPRTLSPVSSLAELFAAQALRTPDRLAVIDPIAHAGAAQISSLTYGELARRSRSLARALERRGVAPEEVVGLLLGRSPAMLIGLLAVLEAGGACLPMDPDQPPARREQILASARPRILLIDEAAREKLTATREETLTRTPGGSRPDMLWLDGRGRPLAVAASGDVVSPSSAPQKPGRDQLLYLIYTSGSTGQPKGVAMTHGPLIDLLAWQGSDPELARPARVLQLTPLGFDVAFQEIFSTFASGGALVLIGDDTRRDALALRQELEEQRIERLFLPFVALHQLAEAAARKGASRTLREVVTAGEQLQITPAIAGLFGALSPARLHNHYGPTETHVVTAHTLSGAASEWPVLPPIGRPVAGCAVHVLDPFLAPLPPGVVGELFLGGGALARGYIDRPGWTAERFVPDPFGAAGERLYRSGDLARRDTDGVLQFLGRRDHQVKVRGFRIEPGEIETALAGHPVVREAVVTVRGASIEKRHLVAHVVFADGVAVEERSDEILRRHLSERLPAHMVPSIFAAVDALPLTASGKVDRRRLPDPVAAVGEQDGRPFVAPETPMEELLTRIFAEVLELERVSTADSFFDLGGHSLLAIRVQFRLQEELGFDVPPIDIFRHDTAASLARHLESLDHGVEKSEQELVAAPRSEKSLDELLASLDDLSEEDLLALLEAPDQVAGLAPDAVEVTEGFKGDDP